MSEKKYAIVAVIRAIPMPGHKRRWAGEAYWVPDPKNRPDQEMEELPQGGLKPVFNADGSPKYRKHALPWPDFEVKVGVVDEPVLFNPEDNGGVPLEITPRCLELVRRDPRIAVNVISGPGGDSEETIATKAKLAEKDEKLEAAMRHVSALQEQVSAARESEAAKASGEIAKLRQEIADLKAKLAEKKR